MDFVAIDFETANGNPSSACQLAAVVVEGGQIVAEHCWLLRPPRAYFSPRNIAIHGIRPRDVANSPTMETAWLEFQPIIDGRVLVAHNAGFDIAVLIHSLAAFEIACPLLEFTCTRLLARRAWPGRSRYGLKPLGDAIGVQFKHHDALEDARCCAKIALAIAGLMQASDLPSLEAALQISRGSFGNGQTKLPRSKAARASGGARMAADRWGFPNQVARRGRRLDSASVLMAAAQSRPLEHKNIVMLGPLGGLDLEETHRLLSALGANVQSNINASTDFVVACGTTLDTASQRVCESLGKQPEEDDNTGAASRPGGIRLLSERQFRALLPAGKATTRW